MYQRTDHDVHVTACVVSVMAENSWISTHSFPWLYKITCKLCVETIHVKEDTVLGVRMRFLQFHNHIGTLKKC